MRTMNFRVLICVALLLGGCAQTSGNPLIRDDSRVHRIIEGTSTWRDVQALIGDPMRIVPLENGEAWEYGYSEASTSPLLYVPIVNFVVAASGGAADITSHDLSVVFDRDGVVRRLTGRTNRPTVYLAPGYGKSVDHYEERVIPRARVQQR